MTAYEKKPGGPARAFRKGLHLRIGDRAGERSFAAGGGRLLYGRRILVVTHGRSAKVREMKANPCVSLCSSFHTFMQSPFHGTSAAACQPGGARSAGGGRSSRGTLPATMKATPTCVICASYRRAVFSTRTGQATGWISSTDGGGIPLYSSGRNGFTAARKYSGILKRAGAHKAPALILHL